MVLKSNYINYFSIIEETKVLLYIYIYAIYYIIELLEKSKGSDLSDLESAGFLSTAGFDLEGM